MGRAGRAARHTARPHAVNDQHILFLLDPHAAGLKPARHRVDPVAFLHAQLLHAPHDGRPFGKGRDNRQDRIFVYHAGGALLRDLDGFQG